MTDKWKIAESKRVQRKPSAAELDAKRRELMSFNHIEETRAAISLLPQGEERIKRALMLEVNINAIEDALNRWMVEEWITEYRDPTDAEKEQRDKDMAENKERENAEKQARKDKKERADNALKKLGLTKDELKSLIASLNEVE